MAGELGGAEVAGRSGEVLGRWGFVTGVPEYDRPFLGPFHPWCAVVPGGAYLQFPVMVRLVLKWLVQGLPARGVSPCARTRSNVGEVFRADAKTEAAVVRLGA